MRYTLIILLVLTILSCSKKEIKVVKVTAHFENKIDYNTQKQPNVSDGYSMLWTFKYVPKFPRIMFVDNDSRLVDGCVYLDKLTKCTITTSDSTEYDLDYAQLKFINTHINDTITIVNIAGNILLSVD